MVHPEMIATLRESFLPHYRELLKDRDAMRHAIGWNPYTNSDHALEVMALLGMDLHHGENDLGESIITAEPVELSFSECPAVEFIDSSSIREAITRSAYRVAKKRAGGGNAEAANE